MSSDAYAALLRELFPRLGGGIRWGLDRTRRLLAAVGDPHLMYPVLHIGGTNGKGSVAATAAAILRAGDRRVGLYTSPHLCTFRERIRIEGMAISEAALLDAAERLRPEIEREAATFFEATTAIAFLALAQAGVEVAVIEVGLGGRLDSTNVVAPISTAVTNVAMDHAEYLGDSLEAIAAEKAGILKQGVPAVTAESDPVVLRVLRESAAVVDARLDVFSAAEIRDLRLGVDGTRFSIDSGWGELNLHTPLIGEHQAVNTALAVRLLEPLTGELRPTRESVQAGVVATRWPGRLQRERFDGIDWYLDVAHNPAGVVALTEAIARLGPRRPLVAVVGILGDKDWTAMLPPIAAAVDALVLSVPATAPPGRVWNPALAAERAGLADAVVIPSFEQALRRARDLAGHGGSVLVTGSFHTVGDALAMLGLAPDGLDPELASLPRLEPAG